MIRGIVEVFSPEGNKSPISYDRTMSDTLQSMLDWSKTEKELGYHPVYDFISMMKDFKIEMEGEPFAKLWGTGKSYEEQYGNITE